MKYVLTSGLHREMSRRGDDEPTNGQVRDDVGFILIVHLYNFIEQFYFLRCLNGIHIWLPNNLGNGGKPILKRFFKQTTRSASRVAQI